MPLLKPQRLLLVLLLACLGAAAGGFWWLCAQNRGISFLAPHPPAEWIVYPMPLDGAGYPAVDLSTEFRRSFVLDHAEPAATLYVCSFKQYQVTLNGEPMGEAYGGNWKQTTDINASGILMVGTNTISVTVSNENGPPALWLSLKAGAFTLNSDTNWEASIVGAAWQPARLASASVQFAKGNTLYGGERLGESLRSVWPLLLVFTLLAGGMVTAARWWLARGAGQGGRSVFGSPAKLVSAGVVALAAAWILLWCNNLGSLPMFQGFDVGDHLKYIKYILDRHSLPLANEGFEMYQPPLYYMLSAGVLALFHCSTFDANGLFVLRLFGMACGIATFILVWLSLRLVFPDRPERQFFGLLLAGCLPANLYLYHYVTNEILATTMVAASVYFCLRVIVNPQVSWSQHAMLGVAVGAALLSKSSTVVALAVIGVVLVWNLAARGIRAPAEWFACLGAAAAACVLVAGWHYARVAAHFGNPLVGNWDAASGFNWWQQQGYRTGSYYMSFGQALVSPIFSAFASFWDGMYSTLWGDALLAGYVELPLRSPWNYGLMTVGYVLALLPTLAILLGAALTLIKFLRHPRAEGVLFLGLASLVTVLLVYYSLKVPSYATAKAFYGSAALVPICFLGAAGWDALIRRAGPLRHVLRVGLLLWAVNAYATFWIRSDAPDTRVLIAQNYWLQGNHEPAVRELSAVLLHNPHDPAAAQLMVYELLELGQVDKARDQAEQTVRWSADDAESHLALGKVRARQGKLVEAVAEARRAIELAPDHLLARRWLAEWLRDSGETTAAVAACREALRAGPTDAKAHELLGELLTEASDPTNALAHFRLAAQVQSDWPDGRERYGRALMTLKQWDGAITNLLAAARLKPADASYRYQLALCLTQAGQTEAAIDMYRQTLGLDPAHPEALNDLAWLLATHPDAKLRDGAQAVQLATRACELTRRKNAHFLTTLAAAYAEAGRFDDAITTAQQAGDLARQASDSDTAALADKLTKMFQARRPYHRDAP